MKMQDVIEEIKLELTGYVLETELENATLQMVVNKVLREIERYWDETTMVTVPFRSCIDTSGFDELSSSIVKVYRTEGFGENSDVQNAMMDPMYAQQWLLFSSVGGTYNLSDYVYNLSSYMTTMQIKNTLSTDMAFTEDKHNHKLYINHYMSAPSAITIQYIPKLKNVEDIKSDYWIDILIRMSVAMTKVILGRIRTRFTQSNALWSQDGEKLLDEGMTDLRELRETLRSNSNLIYPID